MNTKNHELSLMELVTEDEQQSFNQRCRFGNLIEGHAVYCHCENPESPRKCRQTWYFGEKAKGRQDEDCKFFEANPNYKKQKESE